MYFLESISFSVLSIIFLDLFLTKNIVNCSYSHEWAVQIRGGDDVARDIANRHGFIYLAKIFGDVYHFQHSRLAKRSASPSHHHQRKLEDEPWVSWSEQQVVKKRVKRDLQPFPFSNSRSSSRERRMANFSDPKWPDMWYLNRGGELDMNVQKAWAAGITGKGVVVTILDDGLEKNHPDLVKNYDPYASLDVNGRDSDPMPRYDVIDSNRHGTRCAGEVAADANNSICAVGVAYEASIGGVRMLDGDVTDAVEARSLSLAPDHIDIYSASWGPDDDGKTVDGPGQLATRAFLDGITNGRKGKGSIFVWASGNGGRDEDNCNCDGYTNAIWTLSISSATEKGRVPWYSEACSSTLASTYSSGANGEAQIITTDLHQSCTNSHTGTSASAPLAAGICALALDANHDLTWRDMQHIVVRTARPQHLFGPDWQTNGVGRRVSHRFGYGLMDAFGMVQLARNWTTVPQQQKCDVPYLKSENKIIPQKSLVTLSLEVSDCKDVNFLEHVQAKVSLMTDRRGEIEIFLTSPAGTKSTLLAHRPRDNSRTGFHSWPFMTVHMWGENPLGIWKLEIHNNGRIYSSSKTSVQDWTLLFYGTKTEPGKPTFSVPPLVGNSVETDDGRSHSPHSKEGGGKGGREGDKPLSSLKEQDLSERGNFVNEDLTNIIEDEVKVGKSSASASPTPSPVPILNVGGSRLAPGCAAVNALGVCLGWLVCCWLFHWVVVNALCTLGGGGGSSSFHSGVGRECCSCFKPLGDQTCTNCNLILEYSSVRERGVILKDSQGVLTQWRNR